MQDFFKIYKILKWGVPWFFNRFETENKIKVTYILRSDILPKRQRIYSVPCEVMPASLTTCVLLRARSRQTEKQDQQKGFILPNWVIYSTTHRLTSHCWRPQTGGWFPPNDVISLPHLTLEWENRSISFNFNILNHSWCVIISIWWSC